MSVYVLGAFYEVYMNPHRCGHETQNCLRNTDMKESENVNNTLIDGYYSLFHFQW
jgi:hypothetical protein